MATNNPRDPAPAAVTCRAPALVCPECGDPVQRVAPREWPLAGWVPRPAFSHRDGTPLCPVFGARGCAPADPVGMAPNLPDHA